MMDLSHENRLLVCCMQAGISESEADRIKDIIKLPLQWEEFLASAQWHGVAPLIYRNIKDLPEDLPFPSEVMEQLKATYYATLVRNILLFDELKKVLADFREEGLEVILLKGAALAKTVYADIGMRPMGDLDILIKRADLPQAEQRLSALGYVFHGKNPPEWWRKHHYHIGYIHPAKTVRIELHWHITNEYNPLKIRDYDFDIIERFWGKAHVGECFGSGVHLLSPEDSLLYLTTHFLKHRFFNSTNGGFTSRGALLQLSDILRTLRRYGAEIDWARLRQEAGQHRIYHLIDVMVGLVSNIFWNDALSPAHTSKYPAERPDNEIIELLGRKIFIREETRTNVPGHVINALKENTLRDAGGKILRNICPPPEVISDLYAVPLSSKRLYFYYIKRPFDLFLKHRKMISEIPRMKEDVILNRWIDSRAIPSDAQKPK